MHKLDDVQMKIFLDRYALKDGKGNPIEKTIEEMWLRVSKTIASVEKDKKKWEQEFYSILEDFKFVPGGRISAGAGMKKDVTLFNCFVIPVKEDSRGGIMQAITQTVELTSRGGGVGINWSILRPRNSYVKGVNGVSSGSVSWIQAWDGVISQVIQGGCVVEGTLVQTKKGLIPVEKIKVGDEVWTEVGWKKIKTFFNNGVKNVFKVITKHGFEIEATPDHKFSIFNYDKGQYEDIPLDKLTVDDSCYLLLGGIQEREYVPLVIDNYTSPRCAAPNSHNLDIVLPTYLNEKLAYVLGYLYGDGCVIRKFNKPASLSFPVAHIDSDVYTQLKNYIKDIFNYDIVTYQGKTEKFLNYNQNRINSVLVTDFLRTNDLLKQKASQLIFPEKILTSPPSVQFAFLSGYFDADGYYGKRNGFTFSSICKPFLDAVMQVLLSNGIGSRIHSSIRKVGQGYGKDPTSIYKISVTSLEFEEILYNNLSFSCKAKRQYKKRTKGSSFSCGVNLGQLFKNNHLLRNNRFRPLGIASNNSLTSRNAVKRLSFESDILGRYCNTLLKSIESKIASISLSGERKVYDLEVEDIHRLSFNGFYTSNSRRGALMGMINISHPDVEEFITVKQNNHIINQCNLSVCITDSFMNAVKENLDWNLEFPDTSFHLYDKEWCGNLDKWKKKNYPSIIYKTVKARYLWNLIIESAWKCAEPGIWFQERANKLSNTWYCEDLISTNPCSEIGLGPYGVCNLGHINLSKFVLSNGFDYDELSKVIKIAVRFLDNVIECEKYVLNENKEYQKSFRKIGLGTLGLADALIKLKIKYGSSECINFLNHLYKCIQENAYLSSIELAVEKGAFPIFDYKKYLEGNYISQLPPYIKEKIKKCGIRNSWLLTQAPTGTGSLLSGASSGIEPNFSFETERSDSTGTYILKHYLAEAYGHTLPEYFVSASQVTPEEHVRVQAAIQKYTCNSISKTINMKNSSSIEDIRNVYELAYDLGCKGLTVYRDGSRDKQVLREVKPKGRPDVLLGKTFKQSTGCGNIYITVTENEDALPQEAFLHVSKCVNEETLIYSDEGLLPIKMLGKNADVDTFKPLYREVFGRLGKVRTTEFYNGGIQDTLIIETAGGYRLEGSNTHKIAVLSSSGEHVMKELGNVTNEDYAVLQRNQNYFGDNIKLPPCTFISKESRTSFKNLTSIPYLLTEDLASLFGAIISEGNITVRPNGGFFCIASANKDILERFSKICLIHFNFGGRIEMNRRGCPRLILNSNRIIHWLLYDLGFKRGAVNKEIPLCILRAPKSIIISFLEGLFLDSGINRGKARRGLFYIGLVAEKLIRQLHVLLLNFGVISSIVKSEASYNGKYTNMCYTLRIQFNEFKKLLGLGLKFLEPHKQVHWDNVLNGFFDESVWTEKIPFIRDSVIFFIKNVVTEKELKELRDKNVSVFYQYSSSGMITQNFLLKLKSFLLSHNYNSPYIDMHCDDRFFYRRIKDITKSRSLVYDFHIPDKHLFDSSGFISHNSGGCVSAFSEAIGRLVSTALRAGVSSDVIKEQLSYIRCPLPVLGGATSCPDAIARALGGKPVIEDKDKKGDAIEMKHHSHRSECPECGYKLVFREGCVSCLSCNYTQCS